ncbi:MAG: leucine-rich repeat domain-containing protein [Clostridia bacterium]|nr:leucine-rich repeat domain-containing protein [Clostridia bacterium]
MNIQKRFFALLLVLVLLTLTVPFAVAETKSGQCGDNLTWSLDDSGTLTIRGTGDMWDYKSKKDAPWIEQDVKLLIVEEGVTSIGNYAFYNYHYLTHSVLPGSLKRIGDYAFCGDESSQEFIAFPEGLEVIGESAFMYSRLQEVVLPNTVKIIGPHAFQYVHVDTTIEVPESVEEIGTGAFAGETVHVDDNNPYYSSDADGRLYNKEKTVLLQGNGKSDWYKMSFTVPDGVTAIGDEAFEECYLSKVVLPESLVSIGDYAFADGLLESISFPNSLRSIGRGAFSGCWSKYYRSDEIEQATQNDVLEHAMSITISKNVTHIGTGAFSGTPIKEFIVDQNNPYFMSDEVGCLYSKDGTMLLQYPMVRYETPFQVPNGVAHIGAGAFICSLCSVVVLPDSVKSIGASAFADSKIKSIIIPNGVMSIASGTFKDCHYLADIVIPDSVLSIGDYAFEYCESLKSVEANGVISIGRFAFCDCNALEDVKLSQNLQYVKRYAFDDSLTIYFGGTQALWDTIVFEKDNREDFRRWTIHYGTQTQRDPLPADFEPEDPDEEPTEYEGAPLEDVIAMAAKQDAAESGKTTSILVPALIAAGVAVVVLLFVLIFLIRKRRRSTVPAASSAQTVMHWPGGMDLQQQYPQQYPQQQVPQPNPQQQYPQPGQNPQDPPRF